MRYPSFGEWIGAGFWLHRDGEYVAVIKFSAGQWYGGASKRNARSAPLHGPYRFKRRAKKKAMEQLALLRAYNES